MRRTQIFSHVGANYGVIYLQSYAQNVLIHRKLCTLVSAVSELQRPNLAMSHKQMTDGNADRNRNDAYHT